MRWLALGGGVTLLAWLPPLLWELSGGPSNVGAQWRSLRESEAAMGLGFSLGRASLAVAPWPVPFVGRARAESIPFGFVSSPLSIAGMVVLGAAGSLALWCRFTGRRGPSGLLALSLFAVALCVLVGRALPLESAVRPEHARWVWVLGAMLWLSVIWAGISSIFDERRRRLARPMTAGLLVLAAVLVAVSFQLPRLEANTGAWAMPRVGSFVRSVQAQLPKGPYLVEPVGEPSLLTVTPAVVLHLSTAGYRPYVAESPLSRGYDDRHIHHGHPLSGTLVIKVADERDPSAGRKLLVRQGPAPGVSGDGGVTLEAYLVPP